MRQRMMSASASSAQPVVLQNPPKLGVVFYKGEYVTVNVARKDFSSFLWRVDSLKKDDERVVLRSEQHEGLIAVKKDKITSLSIANVVVPSQVDMPAMESLVLQGDIVLYREPALHAVDLASVMRNFFQRLFTEYARFENIWLPLPLYGDNKIMLIKVPPNLEGQSSMVYPKLNALGYIVVFKAGQFACVSDEIVLDPWDGLMMSLIHI